ncbi:MAG TPA: hypothetical protein VF263_02630 [Longimicrobiaceae bacterium]
MPTTGTQAASGTIRLAGPRVYALDILVPNGSTPADEAYVLDLNGARCGLHVQKRLYGDDRVQDAVLDLLAEHGRGTIWSVSQVSSSPLQLRFDSDRVRAAAGDDAGFYSARTAYMPVGDPFDLGAEGYAATRAGERGIDYRQASVGWDPAEERFFVSTDAAGPVPLAEWEPGGVVWPYSYDQRNLPLPGGTPVVNPPELAAATTNKLLSAYLSDGVASLPTVALGMLTSPRGPALDAASLLGRSELLVLKPASAWRSFGVLLFPREELAAVLAEAGLLTDRAAAERSAPLLLASLLWGSGHDLLGVLQPYVQPRLRRSPVTGQLHCAVARVTVVAEPSPEGGRIRCLDVCEVLAPEPREGRLSRSSLLLEGRVHGGVLGVRDADAEQLARVAVEYVSTVERAAEQELGPAGLTRREADVLVAQLQEHTDADLLAPWAELRQEATLRELLGAHG